MGINIIAKQPAPEAGNKVVQLTKAGLPKKKPGQQPYSDKVYQAVLGRIYAYGESGNEACKKCKISYDAFFRWRQRKPENEELYRKAISSTVDNIVDNVFVLFDQFLNEKLPPQTRLGALRAVAEHSRWVAERRDRQNYAAFTQQSADNTMVVINSPDNDLEEEKAG
jgi:hypothetical protein